MPVIKAIGSMQNRYRMDVQMNQSEYFVKSETRKNKKFGKGKSKASSPLLSISYNTRCSPEDRKYIASIVLAKQIVEIATGKNWSTALTVNFISIPPLTPW
jgi:hypothetical protein